MSDERDPARDPDTGGFDADEWFRTQFGGSEPAPPAARPLDSPGTPPDAPPDAQPDAPPDAQLALPTELPEPPPTELLEPPPTELLVELEATQLSEIVNATGAPIGDAVTELLREPEQGGALDELFGNDSFEEYNEALIPAAPRASRRAGASDEGDGSSTDGAGASRAPLDRTQRTLLWVTGSLVAVLAVIAIFFLGTRIPMLLGPAPGAEPSPTPTPTPTPTLTERPVGPIAAGDYRWDELGGGECLEPFVNAWQEEYTVVDCAQPHGGQLVLRAPFALLEGATEQGPYPGEEALAAQMSLLCSGPVALNPAAAGAFTDLQIQGAYPVTEEDWDAGGQDYFCFVSRSSGEPLTGSLAVPPAAPAG